MTVLTSKPEVDAALFAEELLEIYSTPTPKDYCEAKKIIVLIECSFFYNN